MKAMILAAGLGKRMRPLTDNLPKPLLPAAGRPLIEYQIDRLREAGFTDIIINVSYLGHKVREALGDGAKLGVSIVYSEESQPLETAGAISQALQLPQGLDAAEPFVLINGDVWCDFPLQGLQQALAEDDLGHLLLVPNPEFKARGDFDVDKSGRMLDASSDSSGYTFAGISVLRPQMISSYPKRREVFALKEVFDWALQQGRMSAQVYRGEWRDIGTPERLRELEQSLRSSAQ